MSVDTLQAEVGLELDKQSETPSEEALRAVAKPAVEPLVVIPERSPTVRDGGAMFPGVLGRYDSL